MSAIQWAVENEASVSDALIASLFNKYPSLQARYGFVGQEKNELMPDIQSAEDLRSLVGLHTIYVHQAQKDGIPYVGFEFGCTWETEHGLGILMHGTRTVEIGYADTAFLRWIAEKDLDLLSTGQEEAPKRPKWPPISRKDG